MAVFVSFLRGINVGGHGKVSMNALRDLYTSLKLRDAQTYIQSGNVVFRVEQSDEAALAKKIQTGIGKAFGFHPEVILRSAVELRAIIAANPFAKRKDVEPNKLVVIFLVTKPSAEVRAKLAELKGIPEELHLVGRVLYVYFPVGMGQSKLPPLLDRILKAPATARNWNSVNKMNEMAAELERSDSAAK